MALAYPYIRFSSLAQADGSSAERQLALAEALAKRHDLVLQPPIEDLGRSAATGANLSRGPLADFIARVHAGQIPRGSWLIVEDPDRVSRGNPQTALNVLSQLVDAGLTIGYSRSGEVVQQGASWTNFLLTYINLGRANEENLRKQQLCKAGWRAAKDNAAAEGKALSRVCPLWLDIDSEGRYVPIPDRVELIHRMYQEATVMGLGSGSIARRFNGEGIPMWQSVTMLSRTFRATWDPTYIAKILSHRTVLGDFQPKNKNISTGGRVRFDGPPIPNFYPPVVDLATWQRAQASRAARRGTGGTQREAVGNLLSGIVKCDVCGSSMTLRSGKKGRTTGRYGSPRASYLICTHRLRGTCRNDTHISYPPLEDTIIDLLRSSMLESPDRSSEQRKLVVSIAQLVDLINTDTQNAGALIEPGKSLSPLRLRMLSEIETRIANAQSKKSALENELAGLVGAAASDELVAEVERLVTQMAASDLTIRGEARTIAQSAIRSLLDRVVCHEDGTVTLEVGGKTLMITLRTVDRISKIAHIWVSGWDGSKNERAALFLGRSRPRQFADRAWEIQCARWAMSVDGVLTEAEIRALDAGHIPDDPRLHFKRWVKDSKDNPEKAREALRQAALDDSEDVEFWGNRDRDTAKQTI